MKQIADILFALTIIACVFLISKCSVDMRALDYDYRLEKLRIEEGVVDET